MPTLLHDCPLLPLAASIGLTVLLVSTLTLLIAWHRRSYPGWRGWAAGHTLLILGMLVGTYRPPELELLSVLLGNGLVLVGSLLFVQAFERFAGVTGGTRRLRPWLAVPALLAVLFVLTVWVPSVTARFLLVSAYLTLLQLTLLRLIVSQMRRQPTLRGAYGLNLGLLVSVFLLTVPRTLTLSPGTHPEQAFAFTVPNVLMFLSVLLLSVGGAFAFWLLHDDRRRADMQALQDELTRQAHTDPLTTLLNRRGMDRAYERWRTATPAATATLVVLDIDEFKAINDLQGHTAGDAHLVALGRLLLKTAAPGDLVGRSGGDEFTLLLTGDAGQVDRQLRDLRSTLTDPNNPLGFTVSLGCTPVLAGDALTNAVGLADDAMYGHKAQGRPFTLQMN